MAIKHVEIQIPDGTVVNQASLDELYIAMDNFDETSTVKGNVIIGNYTPSVINAIQEKYNITITPQSSAKKYIEINLQHRGIQKEFAKYSNDNSDHVTEEAASQVTSIVINPSASDIWDFDGLGEESWFDKFSNISSFPSIFSNNVKPIKLLKYTGGIKSLPRSGLRNAKITEIRFTGNLNMDLSIYELNYIKIIDLRDSVIVDQSSSYSIMTFKNSKPKLNLNGVDFSNFNITQANKIENTSKFYHQRVPLMSLSKLYSVSVNKNIIIGYLGTDKVGKDGTNWTYDSFDEEEPDETLMAYYDQDLYDYMVDTYGEEEALQKIPSKEDYLNSRS